jgi:hypothetical protein
MAKHQWGRAHRLPCVEGRGEKLVAIPPGARIYLKQIVT